MSDMNALNLLIDKAKSIAGSDAALARSLGVLPQRLANWRNGSASCAPEDQALIASVAGLDPAEFLVRAVVLKHQGTAKGDRLMKVLGKSSIAIGAVLGSAGAAAHQIFSMVPAATTWTSAAKWIIAIYTISIMTNFADAIILMSSVFTLKKCNYQ